MTADTGHGTCASSTAELRRDVDNTGDKKDITIFWGPLLIALKSHMGQFVQRGKNGHLMSFF